MKSLNSFNTKANDGDSESNKDEVIKVPDDSVEEVKSFGECNSTVDTEHAVEVKTSDEKSDLESEVFEEEEIKSHFLNGIDYSRMKLEDELEEEENELDPEGSAVPVSTTEGSTKITATRMNIVEDDKFEDENNIQPTKTQESQLEKTEFQKEQVSAEDPSVSEECANQMPVDIESRVCADKSFKNRALKTFEEFNKDPIKGLKRGLLFTQGLYISHLQKKRTKSFVEQGQLVRSKAFDFIKLGNRLMLYRYNGVSAVVKIPAYVGKLPVTMIHPEFLNSDYNPFDSYKVRVAKNAMNVSENFDESDDNSFDVMVHGISEVILPNTLKTLYGNVFSGCRAMTYITIPESVTYLDNKVFNGSGISEIYFNGTVPKGFDCTKFYGDVYVRGGD